MRSGLRERTAQPLFPYRSSEYETNLCAGDALIGEVGNAGSVMRRVRFERARGVS